MKNIIVSAAGIALCAGVIIILYGGNVSGASPSGEELFKQNCSVCHVNGGNIINPQKTLQKKDREANNIKTVNDIIRIVRNPGPGMTKFDEKTVSNKDAHKIAEYILKTF